MTNPLETISPENKDSLERLNDERMHNGLEAVPVEPIEGAHDQRGEETEESGESIKELLDDLGCYFKLRNHFVSIIDALYESDYEAVCLGVSEYKDEATSQLWKAKESLEREIADMMAGRKDELSQIKLYTVEECVNALELYGSNAVMREIITCKLRNLACAQ